MAYHFRKLKQTLRIIPLTKSVGFSTRVNEGDQTKNSHLDGSQVGTFSTNKGQKTLKVCEALLCSSISLTYPLLRSASDDPELRNHLLPPTTSGLGTTSLPVLYKQVFPSLLAKVSEEDFPDEKDPVLSVVKSVSFTSDDILVQFPHSCTNSSIMYSVREQIPVDVLRQHSYYRLAQTSSKFSCDSSDLDCAVVGSSKARTFTDTDDERLKTMQLLYSSDSGADSRQKGSGSSKDGPSPEQMLKAREKLEGMVRTLFKGNHNCEMLHKHVVMENNLFGDNKVAVGVTGYKLELLKLRLRIHAQLFSTSMDILSVTPLEQPGVIRIHWRLKGLPQIQHLKFWRQISKDDWEWVEAFSYFHIGKDGLVHKHRIDRMMPDNEGQPDLTEKLRGLLNPAKPLVN